MQAQTKFLDYHDVKPGITAYDVLLTVQTKSILAGPYAITTATNLGAFLTLYKTQNWAVIQQRYFIGQGIATALASYLSATTTNYVMPTLQTVFNQ